MSMKLVWTVRNRPKNREKGSDVTPGDLAKAMKHLRGQEENERRPVTNARPPSDRENVILHDLGDKAIRAEWKATKKALTKIRGAKPDPYISMVIGGLPPYDDPDRWADDKEHEWAAGVKEWVESKFSGCTIAGIAHHRVEASPHIHVILLPHTRDGKGHSWKQVCQEVCGQTGNRTYYEDAKKRYAVMRRDLWEATAKPYGIERGVVGIDVEREEVAGMKAAAQVRKAADRCMAAAKKLEADARQMQEEAAETMTSAKRMAADADARQIQAEAVTKTAAARDARYCEMVDDTCEVLDGVFDTVVANKPAAAQQVATAMDDLRRSKPRPKRRRNARRRAAIATAKSPQAALMEKVVSIDAVRRGRDDDRSRV